MINKEMASMAIDRLNEQMAPFASQLNPDNVVVTLRTVTGTPRGETHGTGMTDEVPTVVTADASVRVHFHATSKDLPKSSKTFRNS